MSTEMQLEHLSEAVRHNIKRRRVELGLTQGDVAKAIGAHAPYVSDIESGKRNPTLSTLAKLSEALRVPPAFFLMPQSEKTP